MNAVLNNIVILIFWYTCSNCFN